MTRDERNRMVLDNVKLAYMMAQRYKGNVIDIQDLQQIAMLGLVKAVDGFDPARGCAFSTYACRVIQNELFMAFRKSPQAECELDEIHEGTYDMEDHLLWQDLSRVLTSPEYVVLQLVTAGAKQREIAIKLGVSLTHVGRLYRRAKTKVADYFETEDWRG
jgi:RNA polymerase sigma factor (sigma-70 family)